MSTRVVERPAAIRKCLDMAVTVPNLGEQAAAMREENTNLLEKSKNLLPIERLVQDELAATVNKTQNRMKSVQAAVRFGAADVRRLDLEVLTWRRKDNGYPTLALHNVNTGPYMTFTVRGRKESMRMGSEGPTTGITPELPASLVALYEDVFQLLWNRHIPKNRSDRVAITAEYKGAIPPEARETIKSGLDAFGQGNVYLMTEPNEWDLSIEKGKKIPIHIDPIIIGYAGEELWVLGSFDPSPTEQYVLAEWTANTLPQLTPGS